MPYHITCPDSGFNVTVDCACHQVGHDAVAAGVHHEQCQMNNLTANLPCSDPGVPGCCEEDHDHEAAAAACPGGHGECPEPATCRQHLANVRHYEAMAAHAAEHDGPEAHAFAAMAEPPGECPGGHCHRDIKDCTVCHPVIITAGGTAAVLRPVTT